MLQVYNHDLPFKLERGGEVKNLTIGYHTYGSLSPSCDNVIWVCHALTANSDVKEWWPNTVESGRFLDPDKYFIVCANVLGSQYGTTGPLSENPTTGHPYFQNFPHITVRDIVRVHQLLAKHLRITRLYSLIGSSLGGFQAMEWSIMEPGISKNLFLIATSSKASPWVIALNESQRMAIESDSTYGQPNEGAGAQGLKTARTIALLSYRGQSAYDMTQHEGGNDDKIDGFRASSYQRYQGEKLAKRFSSYTYSLLTKILDGHNVARGRSSLEAALGMIDSNVNVIAVSSDILFSVEEHKIMCEHIKGAKYYEIDSQYGHDGFLVENDLLNDIILGVYNSN